ncbi:polyisoprenyl-phosphate glycosyltransferase [Rhodocyclaceae bacterium]|nr:polyisoprenyl-phosphate glycosyltransferase [Rhodocyclaceae bacterium]
MSEEFVPPYLLELHAAERPADPLVSCVVPAYNEAENIVPLLETLHRILGGLGLRHELIVVDDGSRDATVELVMGQVDMLPLTLVQLSRNFGKEIALSAGIDHATGDVAVLIDGDFQHPPELVPEFLQHWRKGYDMVFSVRADREGESASKRWFTRAFYALLNMGSTLKIPENTQDFRVLDRRVLDALRAMPERNRFMKGLYNWVGFTRLAVVSRTDERRAGESSFNFWRLFGLALTGLTSFSNVPLRVWSIAGGMVSAASILYAFWVAMDTLIWGNDVAGWPTLTVGIMFLGGVQLLSIGVLGEYIGRIYAEVKQRPAYFVSRVVSRRSGADKPSA